MCAVGTSPGRAATNPESYLAEIPWNHELGGNFPAKSFVRITYRQNIDFKELSELVKMTTTRPSYGAEHPNFSHRADGEGCHEKSQGRKNESNRCFRNRSLANTAMAKAIEMRQPLSPR